MIKYFYQHSSFRIVSVYEKLFLGHYVMLTFVLNHSSNIICIQCWAITYFTIFYKWSNGGFHPIYVAYNNSLNYIYIYIYQKWQECFNWHVLWFFVKFCSCPINEHERKGIYGLYLGQTPGVSQDILGSLMEAFILFVVILQSRTSIQAHCKFCFILSHWTVNAFEKYKASV